MKIRREFKVGIFAVIVILVSWWGLSWLGGQDLFKSYNTYYVYYEEVSKDLQVSSRIYIRGVNVGNVRNIELKDNKVKVEIAIEDQYAHMIRENSVALITEGMMGGAQIDIIQGNSESVAHDGATLIGELDEGLMGLIAEKIDPLMNNLTTTIEKLSVTVDGVNTILADNTENITNLIANLEGMSAELNGILRDSKGDIDNILGDVSSFTTMLKQNSTTIESMLQNLDKFSGDVADSNLVEQLSGTVERINTIIAAIENGEGSVGKLLTDDEIHNSINDTIDSLNALVTDLKEHPMRYVHFSLFGKSEEDIAKKEAKKQAKEAKKQAKAASKE
jgi:phospholipid/cholesterol/gamma-HCH transport system substrate-binding protein